MYNLDSRKYNDSGQAELVMDKVFMSGIATSILQLGIAAIPAGLYREWEILVITACGTLLAFSTGILHEWSQGGTAKSRARRPREATYALLPGNAPRYIFIIRNEGTVFELADFAEIDNTGGVSAVVVSTLLLLLWTALLITVSGLKSHTWYIVAVGAVGMLQNTIVAGSPRSPAALGLHLEQQHITIFRGKRAMDLLKDVEEYSPGVGMALLPALFPGALRPDDRQYWADKARDEEQL